MRGRRLATRKLVDLATMARAATRVRGTPPTFVVAGVRRGGSTSLYRMTTSHPDVVPCRVKKGSHYFDVNHHRGRRWFLGNFPLVTDGRITGEGSPYYVFHPLAAERMAREMPDVRILLALRDPVDRAWSHYHSSRSKGLEPLSFEEAVAREDERLAGEVERLLADPGYGAPHLRHHSYLTRGRYAEQLERLYAWFSPDQVLVVQTEALSSGAQQEMNRVWRFLGLPPYELPASFREKQQSYDPMSGETRAALNAHFGPLNERLYGLPGVGFRWPTDVSAVQGASGP